MQQKSGYWNDLGYNRINVKRAEKVLEVTSLKLEIENNGSTSISEDENKDLSDNQCEARVVVVKESSMAATNNDLEKNINDKMEMTSNPSDVEEVEQTKDTM